jgi:hypothetical protein
VKLLLRHSLLIVVSAALSWWLLLGRAPIETAPVREIPLPVPLVLEPLPPAPEAAAPPAQAPAPAPQAEEAAPESEPVEEVAAEEVPPPSELGTPEGEGDEAVLPGEVSEEPGAGGRMSAEAVMQDDALLARAEAEYSGEVQRGFATTFLSSPADQIEIARFFGEELVIVPHRSNDPEASNPHYWKLDLESARAVQVHGRFDTSRYRHNRNLFAYDYGSLPAPLRELRRCVLTRSEVFRFAAMIPAREWAVVIDRREEALAAAERDLDDVRVFVMRYISRPEGGFDLRVEEIHFADGTRYNPS